jgi:hypothetical protein
VIRDSLPIGVVLERRVLDNPWQSHSWHTVEVVPGAPAVSEWRKLDEGEGWTRYHAATLEVELFRGETEGYRYNLSTAVPAVYVVLRPSEEEDLDVEPFLATVCPYEAQDYQESDDEIVDPVPMPGDMIAWVGRFVEEHHVEQPFYKRKRKRHKLEWGRPPPERTPGG